MTSAQPPGPGRSEEFYSPAIPADPDEDRKPPGIPDPPLRAWLRPKKGGLPPDWPPLSRGPGDWSMSLERPEHPIFDGDFEDLVQIARDHDAVEFYVYSVARQEFVQFTAATVQPVP